MADNKFEEMIRDYVDALEKNDVRQSPIVFF